MLELVERFRGMLTTKKRSFIAVLLTMKTFFCMDHHRKKEGDLEVS